MAFLSKSRPDQKGIETPAETGAGGWGLSKSRPDQKGIETRHHGRVLDLLIQEQTRSKRD